MEIEKNVMQPPKNRSYPFRKMEVGDSFLVRGETNRTKIVSASAGYTRRHGMRFSIRKLPEGIRVWRVA